MIQTIEVNKVVTSDMDGDAIGGSINLVTKNSPYKRTVAATAGTGYNWISEKAQLNLGFTYGDRFFNDKLGLIVSASYQNAPSGSYDTEFTWEQDDNGKTYVNDYQIRQYYVTRERQSYSAALDWDLSADYYFRSIGLVSAGLFYKKIDDFIVNQISTNYEYQGNVYTRFTQPKNAGNANLIGLELSYQRDFSFIAPALKCVGFYGTYTYTHSRIENFNFEGRENEKNLSMPGSPEHTANASLYFEKGGLNLRLSYNFASDFIDEMGESTFYDRYYDKVNYMDANASYTFGKKVKTTFYAEANNLLNQPLRYYQGTKDRTMQAEYYGVKVNAGVKINF